MIFEPASELISRIKELTGRTIRGAPNVVDDSSDYMAITYGHVLRVGGNDYFIMGEAYEGRFGISEQPKFWVKRAVDLSSGEQKIIKLNFYEHFSISKGPFKLKGFRSPEKEKEILELVDGHTSFMQGFSVRDAKGNRLRIIDFIKGKTFFDLVLNDPGEHEEYFHSVLPEFVKKLVSPFEGMAFLAKQGQHHGDIRNDHIIVERGTGVFKWIDFDLAVNFSDYDLWCLGNILVYATAKGILTFKKIREHPEQFPVQNTSINDDDALIYYRYRLANLRKVYPYIHPELNRILLRFAMGTKGLYREYEELIEDLGEALSCWPG